MADAKGDESFLAHIKTFLDAKSTELNTESDAAVFWSNDFRPDPDNGGKVSPRNQKLAETLAHSGKGFTVIQDKADGITDKMWKKDFTFQGQEVSIGAKTKASEFMSREFAKRAKGDVTVYANYTGATSFFRKVELGELMENKAVTKVRYIDTKDKEHSEPKEKWYAWQRSQWVDGRIEKLNETAKAWDTQLKEWEKGDKKEKPPEPNSYAVGDFAQEVLSSYRNISDKKNAAPGKLDYIKPENEQGHINTLKKALDNIKADQPQLHQRVIDKIKEGLKDDNERAMFEADFGTKNSSINPWLAGGAALAAVGGIVGLPYLLGKGKIAK